MEAQNSGGNAGEKENKENMGIPGRDRRKADDNLEPGQESLPSDGPVSQSEGTAGRSLGFCVFEDSKWAIVMRRLNSTRSSSTQVPAFHVFGWLL